MEELATRLAAQKTEYLSSIGDIVRKLAGDYFDELWSSPELILPLSRHAMPGVRAGAILAGHAKWNYGSDPRFLDRCFEIATSDVDQPGEFAISALAKIFYGTRQREVERLLVKIILNLQLSSDMRKHAYYALREVEFGFEYEMVAARTFEALHVIKGGMVSLSDLNWELVEAISERGK